MNSQRMSGMKWLGLMVMLALLGACDSRQSAPDAGYGGIALQARWPDQPAVQTAGSAAADGSARPLAVPAGVTQMQVTVSGPGMTDMGAVFAVADHPTGAAIENVPVGTDRAVLLESLDDANNVLHRGGRGGITVTADQVSDAGAVTLAINGSWSPPALLGSISTGTDDKPWVGRDNAGNGVAGWRNGVGDVIAVPYAAGTGWASPVPFGSAGLSGFKLVGFRGGGALGVWLNANQVEASRWDHQSSTWGGAYVLKTGTATLTLSDVNVSRAGNGSAMVVWKEVDSAGSPVYFYIRAMRWSGTNFDSSVTVGTDSTTSYDRPRLGMDFDGNALVGWRVTVSASDEYIKAAYYARTSNSWTAAASMSGTATAVGKARVAFTPSQNAIVVWDKDGDIASRAYVPGTGWESGQTVENSATSASNAWVKATDDFALAVWEQPNGVWYSERWFPAGWNPLLLLTNAAADQGSLRLARDSVGNAFAAWSEGGKIWACRFQPGLGWDAPQAISGTTVSPTSPALSVNNVGQALVVWKYNAETDVQGVAFE